MGRAREEDSPGGGNVSEADKGGGGDGSSLSRYDKWRCNYPQYDDPQIWAKVPSQGRSDAIEKSLKGKSKKD